jgi:hypothetical protein
MNNATRMFVIGLAVPGLVLAGLWIHSRNTAVQTATAQTTQTAAPPEPAKTWWEGKWDATDVPGEWLLIDRDARGMFSLTFFRPDGSIRLMAMGLPSGELLLKASVTPEYKVNAMGAFVRGQLYYVRRQGLQITVQDAWEEVHGGSDGLPPGALPAKTYARAP